jgi:hypothetical protein
VSEHSERQAGQTGDEPERTNRPDDLNLNLGPRPDRVPEEPTTALTQPLGSGAAALPPAAGTAGTVAGTAAGTNGHDAGGMTGRQRRGVRIRTLVFGLVLLAISASTLVTLLTTTRVDGTAVTLVVLIGAGAALVAGGLAAAVREGRGGPGG